MSYKRLSTLFILSTFVALLSFLSIKFFLHKNKSSKNSTVLLVNDTSLHYHWGCFLKSSAIKETLESSSYNVDSLSTSTLYRIKDHPSLLENFKSSSFLNAFSIANPTIIEKIKNADIVIINGEGTLHSLSNPVKSMLYIAYIAKVFFEKPVHVINASLFPNDFFLSRDSDEKQFYNFVLDRVDSIAFRDTFSYELFPEFHNKSILSFDLLPIYIKNHFQEQSTQNFNKTVVVSGSVNIILVPQRLDDLYNYILELQKKGYSIIFLTGGPQKGAYDDQKIVDFFNEKPFLDHFKIVFASSADEWLETIKKATFVVTGRQSMCIAAYILKVPFIAFNSNTPKIEAFFKETGQLEPISLDDADFFKHLLAETEQIETNPPATASDEAINALYQRAKKNFLFLFKPLA